MALRELKVCLLGVSRLVLFQYFLPQLHTLPLILPVASRLILLSRDRAGLLTNVHSCAVKYDVCFYTFFSRMTCF